MAAAAAPPQFTIRDGLILCGIDDANGPPTDAERLAQAIFGDEFRTAMDITTDDLDADLKSFSDLQQDAIILTSIQRRNVKAYIQWIKDKFCQDEDPELQQFPQADALTLIRRAKTHEKFVEKSEAMTKSAKPTAFTETTLWSDWYPTLLNFLRHIPGRDGVPLKYVCRHNDPTRRINHPNFLDDYVDRAPLTGEAFVSDAREVHTWIAALIVGNNTAESKVMPYEHIGNGRVDFLALKEHYEGVGVLAINITKAETTLKTLFYSGEKRPHMWWEEFEKRLQEAFVTYDKRENRVVHSNDMKLRILMDKVNADFLSHIKASLTVELNRIPMMLTYDEAISSFRSEVNRKFPPQVGTNTRSRRSVQAAQATMQSAGRGRGRNNGRGSGRGRGGRGQGRGGRGNVRMTRNDSTIITLNDGQQIEYHPSFNFPPNIYRKMRQQDVERLKKERAEYRAQRAHARQAQGVYSFYPPGTVPPPPSYPNPNQHQISAASMHPNQGPRVQFNSTPQHIPTNISMSGSATNVSQISEASHRTGQQHTMIGGRNEQAHFRQNGY